MGTYNETKLGFGNLEIQVDLTLLEEMVHFRSWHLNSMLAWDLEGYSIELQGEKKSLF